MNLNRMLFVLVMLALIPEAAAAGSFLAGGASRDITPEIGRDIIGGFVPYPSTIVHDPLTVRCLVLDDGTTRLVLVVSDLLGIDRVVSEQARQQIQERYDIPPEHVLISATHTHSASSALGSDPRRLNQPADDYQKLVATRIADATGDAIELLRPAEIAYGTAEAPDHVFNRRWHMRPGTMRANPFGGTDLVRMNPPRASENLVEPAGPTDPEICFLAVRTLDGSPMALYAAYSLHYVGGVPRGHVSADYFEVFRQHLSELVRADDARFEVPYVVMLANGTSGDINNINFQVPRPKRAPYEQMILVGRDVAEKVHDAMQDLEYRGTGTLAAVYREPVIRWRVVTDEQRAWAEKTIAAGRKSERDLSHIYAERTMKQAEYPETTTVPLHALRIGDVCIGTMPFEVFCETGLEFKSRCPLESAFMVELSHGYFGYLPTPRQHDLGGYETWLGTNRVEREASSILLDTLLEMSAELVPE